MTIPGRRLSYYLLTQIHSLLTRMPPRRRRPVETASTDATTITSTNINNISSDNEDPPMAKGGRSTSTRSIIRIPRGRRNVDLNDHHNNGFDLNTSLSSSASSETPSIHGNNRNQVVTFGTQTSPRQPLQLKHVSPFGTSTTGTSSSFDPTLFDFLTKPHTISVLVLMLGWFLYVALWVTDVGDSSRNTKM